MFYNMLISCFKPYLLKSAKKSFPEYSLLSMSLNIPSYTVHRQDFKDTCFLIVVWSALCYTIKQFLCQVFIIKPGMNCY